MIFSVKAMPSMPAGYSHVAKSTQFGFFGVPMVFQVTSTVAPTPFPVRFTVNVDEANPAPRLLKGGVTEAGLDIILTNPHAMAPTASVAPMDVLHLQEPPVELALCFAVTRFGDSKTFLFHVEFFERPNTAVAKHGDKEGSG